MLLVAAPATAQDDPGQPAIVVTGVRIQDYRDRLARCLARNCPTSEDADAKPPPPPAPPARPEVG